MEENGQLYVLAALLLPITPVSIEYEFGWAPEPDYVTLPGFDPRISNPLPKPLHLLRYLDLLFFFK
jgi:hypothetical protein